jgi:hypothetical protein
LSNNKIKDEHLSTESSDDKLDINSLRRVPDLKKKLAQSHFKKLGLLNSESDSESNLSYIDCDSETSVVMLLEVRLVRRRETVIARKHQESRLNLLILLKALKNIPILNYVMNMSVIILPLKIYHSIYI